MTQPPIQQTFDLAVQHHQAGQLPQAEHFYRQVLAQQPGHIHALQNLAVLSHQSGRNDIGIDLLRQAIALNPKSPEAHGNLGNLLKAKGQLDEAIAEYRLAIALKPNYPEAYYNLGLVLGKKGQLNDAVEAYRQAIAIRPDFADALGNLAAALKDQGQFDEALTVIRRAIALQPDRADGYYNLGIALSDKGLLDEAITAFRRATELRPSFAESYLNLANALKETGRLDAAIDIYRRAIELKDDFAEAYSNLSVAFGEKGLLDEALAAVRRAIELRFEYPKAHNNLAGILKDQGRLDEAIAAFRQAVALDPRYVDADSNLLYTLHFHPAFDARAIAIEHRRWNLRHAEPLRRFISPHDNDRDPNRRLRVGYVSPDLRTHPIGRFLMPLLANHDHRQFEVFCYSSVRAADDLTTRLRSAADVWRDIQSFSDEQVARLIREDRIDLLLDLTMHMAASRLLVFARKPAPVQVSWLAYPASTGLSTIDYRLSDPYLDPPGMDESIYSERTIRLPDTFWCYDPLDGRDIPVNSLPALETGFVTFGWLNNFCKINEDVLVLWAQVLRQVENSRLLLLASQGSHRQRILDRLAREGIEPGRVEFVGRKSHHEYLELYHRIDLGLDSFPYNGHTTSFDSLWMGVPVVTLVGQTAVSRAGWCLLSNLGLTDLAGRTAEQFMRRAVELATDLPRLSELRRTLRRRMEQSPLMDATRFARNIEAIYRQMWRDWCETAQT
jgi:protein O-GlcNAc transferase